MSEEDEKLNKNHALPILCFIVAAILLVTLIAYPNRIIYEEAEPVWCVDYQFDRNLPAETICRQDLFNIDELLINNPDVNISEINWIVIAPVFSVDANTDKSVIFNPIIKIYKKEWRSYNE